MSATARRLAPLLLLLLVPHARAQAPAPQPSPSPSFYATATVSARALASASSAVTVIEAGELEAVPVQTAADALADVPGMSLLSTGGRAGTTTAFVRGGDSNFTLVLVDGLPQNDATESTGGSVDLDDLSADAIERAEVVRGPLTSFYGPGSLAGVVQLFTRRGTGGPLRADVGADFGSAGLAHGFVRGSASHGRGAYSVGGSWDQEHGRIGDDDFEGLELWSTADVPAGNTRLHITGRYAQAQARDYPDTSGGPTYGDGALRDSARDDALVSARLENDASAARRQRLTLGVVWRGLERSSPSIPPLVPASQEDTAFTRLRAAYETSLSFGARTALDAGASADNERGTNTSVLYLPAFLGGETPGDYRETRTTAGAFLALRHARGPVTLEGALRADVASGEDAQLNPNLGLVWNAGATRVHASFGRASKLPSFFALASPRALGGNPELAPESALGGELGLARAFGQERFEAGANGFQHEYRELVDFDFESFQLVNRARVVARGVEAFARWRVLASLALELQATWLDAHESAGAPLLHRPRWQGGARLRWQPSPRVDLRLSSRATSSSLDHQLAGPERDEVAGYGVVDLAGSWRPRTHWTVRARLDNLADKEYETLIGFPGRGRSVALGLMWSR